MCQGSGGLGQFEYPRPRIGVWDLPCGGSAMHGQEAGVTRRPKHIGLTEYSENRVQRPDSGLLRVLHADEKGLERSQKRLGLSAQLPGPASTAGFDQGSQG